MANEVLDINCWKGLILKMAKSTVRPLNFALHFAKFNGLTILTVSKLQ